MSKFQMGPGTHPVPMSLFKNNRSRVCAALAKFMGNESTESTYIFLKGGQDVGFNDTDVDFVFRQESFFQYMFGVKEPDYFGVVNVKTAECTLFPPELPAEYETWMGQLETREEIKQRYEVDEVKFSHSLNRFFQEKTPKLILTLNGINSDSGKEIEPAHFDGIENFNVDHKILHPILSECRVIKSPEEIEVLRYVAKVSSEAHIKVMKHMRPGLMEYEGESLFLHHTYSVGGCRHVSYTCICGSGTNSAILHYGHAGSPNDRQLKDGEMCLFDMGANYCGYAADITCSFPVNGVFTQDQKFIYNAVLDARNAVLAAAKDGVCWVSMHKLACRVLLQRLSEGGLLLGNIDEMLTAGLAGIFMPHGLGHLIGLDVHDVGGYLDSHPQRPKEGWLSKLRFARVLRAGMYVTVEPGCYFIKGQLDRAMNDPKMNRFINAEALERFRSFGGVRIEDDVLITENGNENFAIVPRTVEEIERTMSKA